MTQRSSIDEQTFTTRTACPGTESPPSRWEFCSRGRRCRRSERPLHVRPPKRTRLPRSDRGEPEQDGDRCALCPLDGSLARRNTVRHVSHLQEIQRSAGNGIRRVPRSARNSRLHSRRDLHAAARGPEPGLPEGRISRYRTVRHPRPPTEGPRVDRHQHDSNRVFARRTDVRVPLTSRDSSPDGCPSGGSSAPRSTLRSRCSACSTSPPGSSTLPLAAQEITLAIWLIVKGFDASPPDASPALAAGSR